MMMAKALAFASSLAAAALVSPAARAEAPGTVQADRISADVKVLASDTFEGRAPGSAGEAETLKFLVARFKALGLKPAGENGGYLQTVPLVHTQIQGQPVITATIGADKRTLTQFGDVYMNTVRPVDKIAIAHAPMVFVGYGVKAGAELGRLQGRGPARQDRHLPGQRPRLRG